MKPFHSRAAILILHVLHAAVAYGEVVVTGPGSYWNGLPEGAKGPPSMIYKTDEIRSPMALHP